MEILALFLVTAAIIYAVYKLNQKLDGVDYDTKFFMTRKEFEEIQEQINKRLYEMSHPSSYDIGQIINTERGDIIITSIGIVKKDEIILTRNYNKREYKYQYTGFNKKTQGIEIWEE